MVDVAVKILALIGGFVAAVAAYPYLNGWVFALVAFLGAVAVGIIVGALVYYALNWLLASVRQA